jgi:hypothetical protein
LKKPNAIYLVNSTTPTHRSTLGLTEVGARINGQVDLVDILLRIRARLGSANRTLAVGVADLELIEVGGEGLQLGSFDLIIQLTNALRSDPSTALLP